jgi:DNA-binding SARP family transcriptional activator
MQKTARLNIRLMGTPQVFVGEMPLALKHVKSRALLFYLACAGQSHTREHLATLLWSESGQREAYHSLRSSLYHLRKALQGVKTEEALISDGELLGIDPAYYECDVVEFHRLLAQGTEPALTQAMSLCKGSLLQGFSVSLAPVFEDWRQAESMHLNNSCLDALHRLITWTESREAWSDAIRHAQQILQIDPLAENDQQRLMRLYLRQGEVGLALRQYHQFEHQLRLELDILPSPETRALYQEILHHQGGSRPSTATKHTTSQSKLLPFVGRDDLLHELSLIVEEVKTGRGMTVLIQGEGGIGKTRLLDEFSSTLISNQSPWIVLRGACSPFDDLLSHGPFIEALQYGTSENLNELLAESDSSVPDARGRFFWRVLQTIRSMSHGAPLLLFIDDLQWANSSTLNLFGFISMRLQHLPVMLVGTVQHADAIPALQRLITLSRRRHELRLLSLSPLTQKSIADLLRASDINPNSVETLSVWLDAKSAGNPFLLSEILSQLRAEAILEQTGNTTWQLVTSQWLRWRATFSLPETTHDLVGWRLANISTDARNLLDILAIAAQPIPESVIRNIPGVWDNSTPALVDNLSARGLLTEIRGNSTLTLPHYLMRETLLYRLSNLRRRSIHRQLAEAMESQVPLDDDIGLRQIALHAVAGEDVNRARRYGMQLLPNLPQEYTGAETVDFVQHLHDLLTPTASTDEMVLITRALGTLHQSLGHLEIAGHWHRQTLAWAQKTSDIAAQAEAYFEMSELALMSIDYHPALKAAQDGLELISSAISNAPSVTIGRGHRLLGASLAMEGRDLAAAEEHLQKAVTIHRQIENHGDLCATLFELGNVAAQRGELQRALEFYDESAHVAEAGHIYYYLALACNNFAFHSLLLGQVEAAQQAVAQGIKVAEAYDLLAALLHLYSTKGEIYLHLQEWQAADEAFRHGLVLAEELGSLERQAGYRGGLALAACGRKDFDTARHLLEEALALIAEQGYWHLRTRLQLWLTETLFEQARYDEAGKLLEDTLKIARAQQRTLLVEQGEKLQARLLSVTTPHA